MKNVWPAVVLGCVALVCVTVLAFSGRDTAVIVSTIGTVAVPLLGAMIYGEVRSVRDQTNGNTSRLMDLTAGLIDHLKAHSITPAPEPAPAPPAPEKTP